MRIRIQSLAAFLLILALGPLARASLKIGQSAPNLDVTTFDGAAFKLGKLRGKTVIIHFWATWCPACRREMPVLSAFYKKNRDSLAILALSMDRPRDRVEAIQMMQTLPFPGALASDAQVNEFGPPGALPVTYVIDPQGIVRKIFLPGSGATEEELTESNLTRAIAAPRPLQ